jgi:hypothetical protein
MTGGVKKDLSISTMTSGVKKTSLFLTMTGGVKKRPASFNNDMWSKVLFISKG